MFSFSFNGDSDRAKSGAGAGVWGREEAAFQLIVMSDQATNYAARTHTHTSVDCVCECAAGEAVPAGRWRGLEGRSTRADSPKI